MKDSSPSSRHIELFEGSVAEPSDVGTGEFKQIYELYWQDLCNYLGSRYGNSPFDPEDIAQAAFAKLAEINDPEEIKNPQAFLFATARNIAIDEFRKGKIRLAHQQSVLQTPEKQVNADFSPENVLLERQRLELVSAVIKKLPKIQRTVLLLHRIDRLTYSQIASKYGLSETTVRRHVANAVEKIHKDLKYAEHVE